MQHDHVLKKLIFDLSIPIPRSGGGAEGLQHIFDGGGGGVCRQNVSTKLLIL